MGKYDRHGILPRIRHRTGKHLIQRAGKGIDVRTGITHSMPRLLRGNIVHGSHNRRIHRLLAGSTGNAEVGNLHYAFRTDNNVLRLYIPMNNPHLMCEVYPVNQLQRNAYRLSLRNSSLSLDKCFQGNSFNQFHHNKVELSFIHGIESRNDI